ncbi:unnamed protein product [Rotaria sp. Silwood2]|nr:unnamed protein product [Rotaria sp. Silwood2]
MNLIDAGMGGYITARSAELHSDRMKNLFLLCPAINVFQASHNKTAAGQRQQEFNTEDIDPDEYRRKQQRYHAQDHIGQ